jgi:putative phosphoesterase
MKIGVVSDSHSFLDRQIPQLFTGVDHILHAGDVGPYSLLLELEAIAPVTAVLGNTDIWLQLKLTETIELGGHRLLITTSSTARIAGDLKTIVADRPDVVVFGHTHKAFSSKIRGTQFFNPGYAGKQRFALERSVAIALRRAPSRPEFKPLWRFGCQFLAQALGCAGDRPARSETA